MLHRYSITLTYASKLKLRQMRPSCLIGTMTCSIGQLHYLSHLAWYNGKCWVKMLLQSTLFWRTTFGFVQIMTYNRHYAILAQPYPAIWMKIVYAFLTLSLFHGWHVWNLVNNGSEHWPESREHWTILKVTLRRSPFITCRSEKKFSKHSSKGFILQI